MAYPVRFETGTYAAYQTSAKEAGTLFYTTDTKQVYKGDVEFTKVARVVAELPTIPEGKYGTLYVNTTDNTPYVFNGSYIPIIKPYTKVIDTTTATHDTIPTTKAVKDYVDDIVASAPVPEDIDLKGYVNNATYDPLTRTIALPMSGEGGTDETLTINLGKDIFVEHGLYDNTTKKIELTLTSGEELSIPVDDLISELDITNSTTIAVTVSDVDGVKTYNFDVKISTDEGNILQSTASGLYVPVVDADIYWNEVV